MENTLASFVTTSETTLNEIADNIMRYIKTNKTNVDEADKSR